MNLPKTTEFSLKQIVENLNEIPSNGFGDKAPTLTTEQKRSLREMAVMFDEYGIAFQNEQAIMDSAKAVGEIMKLAETYAVNEGGDWFVKERVQKDFKEAKKKVQEFQQLAQECYTRKQQLRCSFDDIRHVLSRYFKVGQDQTGPTME